MLRLDEITDEMERPYAEEVRQTLLDADRKVGWIFAQQLAEIIADDEANEKTEGEK